MPDNIYRFRHLKWGDPARKLQMLPDEQSAERSFTSLWEWIGIAIGLIAIVAMASALL